jgi:HK97 gp10 family phage protein
MTVRVLYNHIPKVKGTVTGEMLAKALMAGGQVIEANAKINTTKVFSSKSTGGAGLGGSIFTDLVKSTKTSALVHVGPSAVYGAIQEFGGVVRPLHAKMLSWLNEAGERIFAKMVSLPARPYLRPAVDEHRDQIAEAISHQIEKGIKGAL